MKSRLMVCPDDELEACNASTNWDGESYPQLQYTYVGDRPSHKWGEPGRLPGAMSEDGI